MIISKLAKQYARENKLKMNYLSLGDKTPYIVYYNDNPEIPYLGVQFTDNTFGVIGAKTDYFVSDATTMFGILEDGY